MSKSNCDELLIATSNPGKVIEIQAALKELPLRLHSLEHGDATVSPIESGATYAENAIIKATHYATLKGMCSLADDSGLEVEFLGGAPGLHSARFRRGSDSDRVQLLLEKLAGVAAENRCARFVSVCVIVDPTGEILNAAVGECEGRIIGVPRGSNGFGYDPIFVPTGYDETFAQLSADVKNQISHRAKALTQTRDFLRTFLSGRLTVHRTDS